MPSVPIFNPRNQACLLLIAGLMGVGVYFAGFGSSPAGREQQEEILGAEASSLDGILREIEREDSSRPRR